jgi:hypothetical protein
MRVLNGKTPHEVLWGKKPNLTTIRKFGSEIWMLKPDTNLDKLDPKSEKFVYTGPGEGGHAWRYYNTRTRQILMSRNVMFQSRAVSEPVVPEIPAPRLEGENSPASAENKPSAQDNDTAIQGQTPDDATPPSEQQRSLRAPAQIDYREAARYKMRKKVAPSDVAQLHCVEVYHALPDEPQSVAEIKSCVDWLQWKAAMQKEIDQLDRLQTYELVTLPEGRKPIGCKWVFVIKQGSDCEIIKYKARLVAQGFSQIPGQDFVETYAPVCRQESLRASIAIAALLRMHVHQLDVVSAFLHGELEEEIYMRQPPEYDDGSGHMWRLRKAIYGLKQAGRVWNIKLNHELSSLRFSQIPADACAFIRMDDKDCTIAIIHVDDMSLFSTSLDTLTRIKGEIASRLEVTDLGEIKKYLGMEINCNPREGTYSIHQTAYIRSILERFNMSDCNPAHMPMDPTA